MVYSTQKPLFYLGKFPIGATELIILLQVLGMLAVVFTQGQVIPYTAYSADLFLAGKLWQAVTYPFFNGVGLLFFLSLYFFFQFGRVVETQLGRTTFLYMCVGVLLALPLVYTIYHLLGGTASLYYGSQILSLSVFSCFCVMYPNLPTMLLQVPIKWMGLAFLVISLLGAIQSGAFDQLITIIVSVMFALAIVQSKGLAIIKLLPDAWTQPTLKKEKRTAKTKLNSPPPRKQTSLSKLKPKAKVKSETEVDAILDKISEKGLHSLTDKERTTLLNARK